MESLKIKEKLPPTTLILFGVCFALMFTALYLIFMWVPTAQPEAGGIAQRIFYFHVPSAFIGFLSFLHVFVASILYLWKRDNKWDTLAYSAAEIGVIFTTLVLISGPIWAKPAWGRWWVWDQRLTTTLMLWLIYVAYLLVRSYAAERSQGARFAAVVGIVGFIDVPIVYMAIYLWRTTGHPGPVLTSGGLEDPRMFVALMVSLAAFFVFYYLLLRQRIALRRTGDEIEELRQKLDDRGG